MAKTLSFLGCGYEALGSAIVMQAVEDWRNAARKLRRSDDQAARVVLSEVEEFINSPCFVVFCNLNADALLQKLRAEAGMKVIA